MDRANPIQGLNHRWKVGEKMKFHPARLVTPRRPRVKFPCSIVFSTLPTDGENLNDPNRRLRKFIFENLKYENLR